MIVTTAGRTNQEMTVYAKQVAADLDSPFAIRKDDSVPNMQERLHDDILVVGKNRLEIYPYGGEDSFFFHPNSSSFRIKRLMRGEHDPFLQAAQLEEGMTMLDCTLGMASDSIVASYTVGASGAVTGIEGNRYLAYIVKNGLKTWHADISEMNEAMRRISVLHTDHLTYLQDCKADSFDVVYLDPMFEESILESDGIRGLKHFALYNDITDATMEEALRVAKKRVVLKDHFRSSRFELYGFSVFRRKSAKFHFGVKSSLQNNDSRI
ncbi:class I SAM-dependent methyltransferase [Ectobacillus panaciterrae]|uniref:class I SAM-dependent methyltransferase n=1 Tax=Ectobacillus panaciterrae TaxID=363872 RepID=UPI0004191B70|nr:class I SAM-dependent methyltransferase [Ectobacillus panaciterrae]